MGSVLGLVGAVGVLAAGAPQQVAAPDTDVLSAVARFYRDARTLVNGFVRVPHHLLHALTLGPGGVAAYRVDIRVTDARGTLLVQDGWTRLVAWDATQIPGAQSVEPFTFALGPGTYQVQLAVRDSASGLRRQLELPVAAFAARPPASDLLLGYWIRQAAAPADTTAASGELRKGTLFIATAPELTLTPARAALAYYCEVYRDSAGSVPGLVQVIGRDGRVVVSTATAPTAVGVGGGPVVGTVDLAGLPAGEYTLALVVGAGRDTTTRTAAFRMGGFETERELEAAALASAAATDRFSGAPEQQLDSLFAPLVYVAKSGELAGVYAGLSVEGKRRFLRAFWRRRDPTPGTPANEDLVAFYARIALANERFREGGSAQVPGWRTDRGRVFIRYGEPDGLLQRPQSGPDRPWEAWKYTRGRELKFVFLDSTGLGNYALIFTNDRLERNPPEWERLLSQDAIHEINLF